jgi:uncharacterized protein YjiS (DUF1127 family)
METTMRSYATFEAHAHDAASGGGLFFNLIRNWRAQRAVARLSQLDDHLLSDIGVTRDDVDSARRLPLSVNAALLLEERGRERRHRFVSGV